MVTTLHPNPADDVFFSEAEEDSLLQIAFPEINADKLIEEERFLSRIAYVCQRMKVPHLHVGQIDVLRNLERRKDVCLLARTGFGKSLVFQSLYWMLQAKLQQKARDQEIAAAHPKRKITIVFIPLSGIGEEQVETLKDLEEDPNAAFFFDNSKAESHHLDDIFSGKYRVIYFP